MADQNQNNQSTPGGNPPDDQVKAPVRPAVSANPGSSGPLNAGGAAANSGVAGKKPKTEKQVARERERRRRRRKKKAEVKGLTGEKVLRPGDDVPLVAIKEGEASDKLRAPKDNKIVERPSKEAEREKSLPDVPLILKEKEAPEPPPLNPPEPPEEEMPKLEPKPLPPEEAVPAPAKMKSSKSISFDEPLPPQPEVHDVKPGELFSEPSLVGVPEEKEPVVESEPAPEPEPEPISTPEPQEEIITEPSHPQEPLEESQKIFEESPIYSDDSPPEPEEADVIVEDEPLVHEDHFEKANQDKARELHESLLSDQHDHLEEMPVKQGILGKIFDKFAEIVQGRKTQNLSSSMNKPTETIVTEVLEETPGSSPNVSGISSFLANLIKFVVVVALVIGAFWLGSSLKLVDRLSGIFAGNQSANEQLAVGDNSQVVIDPEMLQKWGFDTAKLIGSNLGDASDLTYNVFFNANYFGKLKDPVFYGETGISAAIYYGFGKEVQYAQNRFIYYIQYLSSVVNANSVQLVDVLKTNPRRDLALDNYVKQSQDIFDQGNTLRKEINVQIDDLKVSIDSLAPDKTRYETDFFASMALYDGQKADALLAQFIKAGQTNVELTAKQNALNKLSESYTTELLKLKTRLAVVQANRDALISGVPFSETPAGGITLTTQ